LREVEYALNSAGKLLDFSVSFAQYEQLIVDILRDAFDDQKWNWISFFVYELEFGTNWNEGIIIMDNEDIRMSNAGELYDMLVSE